jgi:hypothetical protein
VPGEGLDERHPPRQHQLLVPDGGARGIKGLGAVDLRRPRSPVERRLAALILIEEAEVDVPGVPVCKRPRRVRLRLMPSSA